MVFIVCSPLCFVARPCSGSISLATVFDINLPADFLPRLPSKLNVVVPVLAWPTSCRWIFPAVPLIRRCFSPLLECLAFRAVVFTSFALTASWLVMFMCVAYSAHIFFLTDTPRLSLYFSFNGIKFILDNEKKCSKSDITSAVMASNVDYGVCNRHHFECEMPRFPAVCSPAISQSVLNIHHLANP